MKEQGLDRRDFLKGAVVGGAAAAGATAAIAPPEIAQAQQRRPQRAAPQAAGYAFLNLDEAAFVEALVDHMIPADELSPKGTDLGINIYIDRALAGAWGKGDRLYMQGPWKPGAPSQGYQLPLTPAQLYRAGIEATNAHCRKTYGKTFDRLDEAQREEVLIGLSTGKITFDNGLPVRVFWTTLYQTVMEGMFSDPIYGGNRNKAGWKIDRLSRRDRGAPRARREISRQAVPEQAARHRGHELRGDAMATKLKEVDVVIVGLGWTGGILAKELTEAGLKVVALERGAHAHERERLFAAQYPRRAALCRAPRPDAEHRARHLTIRNNPSQEALPMRRLGSFLPGEVVGGSGVHWSGHTWRWTDMEFKVRSNYEERYGKNFIPADMTIQDWGITYAELEPYYDKFEYTAAVSGKAGNLERPDPGRAAIRSRRRARATIRCRR